MSQYAPNDPYHGAPQQPVPGGQQQPAPGGYPPAQPGTYPGHPQAGPPGGYPQPYPMAPEHPQGTLILILGVVSIACSPLGFVSWYLGKKAEDEMEASGITYSNAGNIKAGKIIGIVTGILTIVSFALMLVYIVIMLIIFGSLFATMPS